MNKQLTREEFDVFTKAIKAVNDTNRDYLYEIYCSCFEGAVELLESQGKTETPINSAELFSYIVGEYLYSTSLLSDEQLKKFLNDENIATSIASVAADKYLSLSLYNHREKSLTNAFLPPISSLNLYINLMANIVGTYESNNPKNTLIVDLLNKSLSISRSIIQLLCEGYETEAFAIWRTLHECECTLILLDKYGDVAINSYLKHMTYGMAYKNGKQEDDNPIIQQVKSEMAELGLKSKDMKKYIEYGWMNAIPGKKDLPNFKLNFRDGLESLAGLHKYANLYMTSSEILHSTPLLIYSSKEYFFFITLLNLYESFFRIEKVFLTLFFSRVGDEAKTRYMEMRKLYYSQLVNIHQREALAFKRILKK